MKLTPAKLRAARAMLSLTQGELAVMSETSESTVNAYENGRYTKPRRSTVAAWVRTLIREGVVFTEHGVEFGT